MEGQETPVGPGAARRRRVRRIEEPRRPDGPTVRNARRHQEHRPEGPALPRLTAQGTAAHPVQAPDRPSHDGTEPPGVLGVPFAHPRDRRTRQEDQTAPPRHPTHHRTGLLQRQARGVQQQDQGHRPHGLRLPPRHQPHRPGHAQMQRTRHTTATTRNLTHKNIRSLREDHRDPWGRWKGAVMSERTCNIAGCHNPAESNGLCAHHFTRALGYGQLRVANHAASLSGAVPRGEA